MQNETLIFILSVGFIGAGLWLYVSDNLIWVTIDEAANIGTERLQKKFHYLQSKGIRCRLKARRQTSIARGGFSGAVVYLELQVFKKDINRAHEFLTQQT